MSQLLIIDVQNKFSAWFHESDLLNDIEEVSKNYSSIVYLWDNIDGDCFSEEIPEKWDDSYELDENEQEVKTEGFYQKFSHILSKQYGFFRPYMDRKCCQKEELVSLGKFILNNNISDVRDIKDDEFLEKEFLEKFKKNVEILTLYKEELSFSVPYDLIEELSGSLTSGVTLVGGGINECLEEISILLEILDIEHSVIESLTY